MRFKFSWVSQTNKQASLSYSNSSLNILLHLKNSCLYWSENWLLKIVTYIRYSLTDRYILKWLTVTIRYSIPTAILQEITSIIWILKLYLHPIPITNYSLNLFLCILFQILKTSSWINKMNRNKEWFTKHNWILRKQSTFSQ